VPGASSARSRRIAGWAGGDTAARLAASAREDSTASTYGKHWANFADWCAQHNLEPLPATPDMVASYIGSIADRGTVAAASLQPYLSAINSIHSDFGFDKPAVGHLVALVRLINRTHRSQHTKGTACSAPTSACRW